LNEIIRKRKSVRSYEMAGLDSATLEKIRAQFASLTPLYPDIQYSIEIVNKTKGVFNIKAPHYLVFYSEKNEHAYENIGFIGQQMDLFFSESGLGYCWLGISKPEEKFTGKLQCIASMAFGKPAEPLYRDISEFKRKTLCEISEGKDERLEAARLAPSGMNRQNWYFVAENSKIHCYLKKPSPLIESMFKRLACIDLGIAICHLAKESSDFKFTKEDSGPQRRGHVYVGTIH